MKKFALGGITLGLVFSPLAALACGHHGTNAGNQLASWIANNTSGNGVSISAWGSQSGTDNITDQQGNSEDVDVGSGASNSNKDKDGDNNFANANYWVSIQLPNGDEITINTTAQDWDRMDDGGAAVEAWLYEEGLSVIETWFQNYDPTDTNEGTYVG